MQFDGKRYGAPLVDAQPGLDMTKLTDKELAAMMKHHVDIRDGARIKNGAWDMMLEAAKRLEE